ncbi:cytochrome d ubiquinol oxidase subunit II [Bacillus sp. OTU530]|uniref:cytochrome d ubiquinol oxidase subunit II n=1 Tax=Bacillus sp. OTU530 TaxID=3043862 RepID=UPI00313BC843
MHEESIAILILWALVFAYSILGSIDFGTGFWSMIYMKRNSTAGDIANRYLSPTWELTNTFLVFVVVAFIGFFPNAAYSLATAMFVPVTLILALIAVRSSFMVFSHSFPSSEKQLRFTAGITGLLVPALLITVLPVTEGSFVKMIGGKETLMYKQLLSSPSVYSYMLFGLTSALFLSALFLADFSRERGDEGAYRIYRINAIILGPATLLSAVIALVSVSIQGNARWLLSNLADEILWFAVSLGLFVIGYAALWWSNKGYKELGWPRVAVLSVVAQYAFASYAYGKAHLPYIIFPDVTMYTSFTQKTTFYSLLILYAVGIAILLPGFIMFWNLFLKDRTFAGDKKE